MIETVYEKKVSQKPFFIFTPKSPRGDFLIYRGLKALLGGI
jgi:hypothetical protein